MDIGEHARSALWLGTGLLIFVISLSAAFYLFQNIADVNTKTYTLTHVTDKNIYSTLKIEEPYRSTGAEVRQTIHQINHLNVDIEVNGTLYSKNLDPDEVDVSGINLNHTYIPVYVRDNMGNLILLKYT